MSSGRGRCGPTRGGHGRRSRCSARSRRPCPSGRRRSAGRRTPVCAGRCRRPSAQWTVQLRGEESRGGLQDRVGPPQFLHLALQLRDPAASALVVPAGCRRRSRPAAPSRAGPRGARRAGRRRADRPGPPGRVLTGLDASRVARSRSSSGYLRGAAMLGILPGLRCLHQTRGDSVPRRLQPDLSPLPPRRHLLHAIEYRTGMHHRFETWEPDHRHHRHARHGLSQRRKPGPTHLDRPRHTLKQPPKPEATPVVWTPDNGSSWSWKV